jgi:hypothetical protein
MSLNKQSKETYSDNVVWQHPVACHLFILMLQSASHATRIKTLKSLPYHWCTICFDRHWSSSGASKIAVEIAALLSISSIWIYPYLCTHVPWWIIWWWVIPHFLSCAAFLEAPEDDQCWLKHVVHQWCVSDFKVLKNVYSFNMSCIWARL